jgi:hypothetical protein
MGELDKSTYLVFFNSGAGLLRFGLLAIGRLCSL